MKKRMSDLVEELKRIELLQEDPENEFDTLSLEERNELIQLDCPASILAQAFLDRLEDMQKKPFQENLP